ncbi:serine hydroxymethyltransferase, cytosolic isoform X3 [Agrilus planipennis]|nr:serine hydroxymethyltransferase, cytosolic isoform X3 [Agrilus planipennis]XP_018323687.1 serine hydroxymethyltransferase, cytosolic isoform X3 [Agrilus planipennis]
MSGTGQTVVDSKLLHSNVWETDPELFNLMKKEKQRQKHGIELIASENFTSLSVLQCLSSCLHNKYSEGLPGNRYYGGNEYIDEIEMLCQRRALQAYNLSSQKWGVNVQPYSGSPANFAAYTGVVGAHGRIMGLDLPDGGHLTHGFFTPTKKISATSIFFESMPYKVDPRTGLIDYNLLQNTAQLFKPQLIIAGVSCYSRALDYKKFREIADNVGAYLMADMAHISGLVAAGVTPSPFEYCDIVTTTTHKSLRGPRAGVIFFRKGKREVGGKIIEYDLESKINQAVFPALQGGPHNNAIAAMATAFKQTLSQEFKDYQHQIVKNARRLAAGLMEKGYKILTDGTDVHMLLVNVKDAGLSGAKAETILESVHIACNKNTVPGDKSALNPSGIRLGTPAITTRGFTEKDVDNVADFIDRGLKLAKEIEKLSGPKITDFKRVLFEDDDIQVKVKALQNEVTQFSSKFPLPGYEEY